MTKIAQYKSRDGFVFVEVDERPGSGASPVGRNETIQAAAESFESVLAQVQSIATNVIESITALPSLPDEVGVEFGIKLAAGAGAVIAHASTEANFVVKLAWKRRATAAVPA